jgi:hypothetical protein
MAYQPNKQRNALCRQPRALGFMRTLLVIDAVVVNMFCTDALDVTAKLDVPAYFFTSRTSRKEKKENKKKKEKIRKRRKKLTYTC